MFILGLIDIVPRILRSSDGFNDALHAVGTSKAFATIYGMLTSHMRESGGQDALAMVTLLLDIIECSLTVTSQFENASSLISVAIDCLEHLSWPGPSPSSFNLLRSILAILASHAHMLSEAQKRYVCLTGVGLCWTYCSSAKLPTMSATIELITVTISTVAQASGMNGGFQQLVTRSPGVVFDEILAGNPLAVHFLTRHLEVFVRGCPVLFADMLCEVCDQLPTASERELPRVLSVVVQIMRSYTQFLKASGSPDPKFLQSLSARCTLACIDSVYRTDNFILMDILDLLHFGIIALNFCTKDATVVVAQMVQCIVLICEKLIGSCRFFPDHGYGRLNDLIRELSKDWDFFAPSLMRSTLKPVLLELISKTEGNQGGSSALMSSLGYMSDSIDS
mmetsp:Transcript_8836/g.17849  ORF Transcript_8836/g.17849 Transcript_8836/m.17849 type:complete len:393 (+) Transcript_8836:1163-2341(+)